MQCRRALYVHLHGVGLYKSGLERTSRYRTPSDASSVYEVPLLLDSRGAGKLLGLDYKTIEKLARTGQLPGVKLGSRWRFSRDSLIQWCGRNPELVK